jgi:hypothetical protein
MPVNQNSLTHLRLLYWYSLTAAFWPNLTSVVDRRICPSLGGPLRMTLS